MTIAGTIAFARASWRVLTVGAVAGLLAGGLVSLALPKEYQASSLVYVSSQADPSSASQAYQGAQLSEQRIKSYAELATSDRVLDSAARNSSIPTSASVLSSRTTVSTTTDTVLLSISVEGPSPEAAAAYTNAVTSSLVSLTIELERPAVPSMTPAVSARVVQSAVGASSPVSPRFSLNLLVGFLVGLALAYLVSRLRDGLDRRIRSADEICSMAGAPLMGEVSDSKDRARQDVSPSLLGSKDNRSEEELRRVRVNLQYINVDRRSSCYLVTSAIQGEGKTSIATGLARMLAAGGTRTLVIDADLRRPSVAQYMSLDNALGLGEIVSGKFSWKSLVTTVSSHLDVIVSGPIPPNPGELVGSSSMQQLLSEVSQVYDFVLVDAPPVLPVVDSVSLSKACDGVLLVSRYALVTKEQTSLAVSQLDAVDSSISGVIFNGVPRDNVGARFGGYGYYDNSGSASRDASVPMAQAEAARTSRAIERTPRPPAHERKPSPVPRNVLLREQ